jgi:RimJ/RimL family protein N-acetyltransferase
VLSSAENSYTAIRTENGHVVGMLKTVSYDDDVEVTYRISRHERRKGIASRALITKAQELSDDKTIILYIDEDNTASQALAEGLGFK